MDINEVLIVSLDRRKSTVQVLCPSHFTSSAIENYCNLQFLSIPVHKTSVKKTKIPSLSPAAHFLHPYTYTIFWENPMYTLTLDELSYRIITSLFLLGTTTLVTGVIVLLTRTMGKDLRSITKEASKLARKGMVDDLSGLVGNASALLTASSQMIKTTAGVGIMLIVLGLAQVGTSIGMIVFLK